MPKFGLVQGKKDDSPAGKVRERMRQSARPWPHCPHCGGRETITARIGNVRNKLCVACLVQGRRVVID